MPTEVSATSAPVQTTKRIGWILLVLALATPLLLSIFGVINAFRVGELTVQVGFGWLVTAVVIDLLTRKRDAGTKANGRIVAATLALVLAIVSAFTTYQDNRKVETAKKELIEEFMAATVEARNAPVQSAVQAESPLIADSVESGVTAPSKSSTANDADRVVGFLNATKGRAKAFAEQSAALDRKFKSLDMGSVLAPQVLTSKTGIQASQDALKRYNSLIAERDDLLTQHFVQMEKVIRSHAQNEREVKAAMEGMRGPRDETVKVYADLSAAQRESLKAIGDMLNFAEDRRATGKE